MTDTATPAAPHWQRGASSIANLLLCLWPNETKDWGHAFAAELDEIETPLEASRWLLGGLMLLTRERFKSFFRSVSRPVGIPAGGNLELFAKQSARVPRTPRIVTVLFLLASLAILLHPEVRTAVRSIVRGYINPKEDTSRWSSVRQLRKEAESTQDPKLFALLSLLTEDDIERSRLADQAIALDASLTWIDYENTSFNMSSSDPYNSKRLTRLEAWDPGNATVRLLSAEAVFESSVSKHLTTSYSLSSIAKHPDGTQWLTALNRAYEAEKYDNYSSRLNQLIRDISTTHPRLDPDIAAFIFPRARIPNLMNIRTFGKWLVSQGQEAEQRGDLAAASDNYWKVVRFSALMRHSKTTLIERLIGMAIGREALENLQPLLAKTGQPHQAELFALQLAEWHRFEPSPWRDLWASFEWSALNLQLVAALIFVLSIISALSLLVSIAARRSSPENGGSMPSLASWSIDACPPLLLLCSSALYSIYHPFAEVYRRFLNVPSNPPDMEQLQVALYVTHPSELQFFNSGDFVFRSWFAVTSIPVLLVLAMIARMFFRRPSAEPHP